MDQALLNPTTAQGTISPFDVVASLTFIRPQAEKPVLHSQAYTGGAPRCFFEVEERLASIADLRVRAGGFELDKEGFSLLLAPTAVRDLYDDDTVESRYFAEIKKLLAQELGASRVVIFDVTRRSDSDAGAANKEGRRGTAARIHVDYTTKSGEHRARDVLGEFEFARLIHSGARLVQVNVWRPIVGPVLRSPLAVADAGTIEPGDLVATDQIFPDRVGEIYHLAYNPGQRWYYAPAMTPDEVLLIKGWDSLSDGRARFTPHSAFALPEQERNPPRESIEVRTIVVIE